MPKRNLTAAVGGRNVYLTKRGQTVYYDAKTKNGYIVDQRNSSRFMLYNNRLTISLVLLLGMISYGIPPVLALFSGVGCYIILDAVFRKKFLTELNFVTNFVPETKRSLADTVASSSTFSKALFYGIVLIAFGVALTVNSVLSGGSRMMIAGSAMICVFCITGACICFKALTQMQKN